MLAWLHINTDPINLRKPIHPNKMERMEGILSHEGQCSQRMLRNTMLSGVDLPSPFLSSSSSSSYASTLARDKAPYDKYAHSYTLGVGASCRNMMRPSSSRRWIGQTRLWSVACKCNNWDYTRPNEHPSRAQDAGMPVVGRHWSKRAEHWRGAHPWTLHQPFGHNQWPAGVLSFSCRYP